MGRGGRGVAFAAEDSGVVARIAACHDRRREPVACGSRSFPQPETRRSK